jgi:hypothetical protein
MRSNARKVHYFHAEANSLGGFIDKPIQNTVTPQASSSLPAVGGHASHRTEAFNFEGILSCRSANTRVSGRHIEEDGSPSTVATSVVEGLNIAEVVTADRIVAQVSIVHPAEGGAPVVSFTGSRFEGLQIAGCDASLALNSSFQERGPAAAGSREPITWPLFHKTGKQQAAKLIKSAKGEDGFQWIIDRYGWLASESKPNGCVLCSLVDGVDPAVPGRSFGHVLHVPNFGKIIFGEVMVFPASVHLSMIRAELGSPASAGMNISSAMVNGGTFPP